MTSWADTVRLVESRAAGRCEYCRMHQSLQGATFHVEHIIPSSRGGSSDPPNLAWSCPGCNLRKSDRIDGIDPQSGLVIPLFNPRADRWTEHLHWEGYRLVGDTALGRTTVTLLDLNHARRLLVRQAEDLFGLFPP